MAGAVRRASSIIARLMNLTKSAEPHFSRRRLFAVMSAKCAVKLHGTPPTRDAMRATVEGGPAQCAWIWSARQPRASFATQSAFGNDTRLRRSTGGFG